MLLTWLLVLHFFSSQGKNFLVNLGEEIDQFQSNNATEYSSHGNDYSNQGSNRENVLWVYKSGQLTFSPSLDDGYGQVVISSAAGSIQAGQWYHFATTVDTAARKIRLYLNGTLDTE